MAQCITCGFLTRRQRPDGALVEADGHFRDLPLMTTEGHYRGVLCFVQARDFGQELRELEIAPEAGEAQGWIGGALSKEIDCSHWRQWTQGFTPKEHAEMMSREFLEAQAAERRKEDRRWHIFESVMFTLAGAATGIVSALIARS